MDQLPLIDDDEDDADIIQSYSMDTLLSDLGKEEDEDYRRRQQAGSSSSTVTKDDFVGGNTAFI